MAWAALACLPWQACFAEALQFCDLDAPLSAADQDKLFRFGELIRGTLEASGQPVALLSRSGLDLDRFGQRYSHAGISLQAGRSTPWSVRQLYYACDERKPWLYDQGLASFVLGTRHAALGYVSVVFLPPPQARALADMALDSPNALALLGEAYSANAYPFSSRYQNCNQWVLEMLATAWGGLAAESSPALRDRAQQWLRTQDYEPTRFEVAWQPMMWFSRAVPWLHGDDHPAEDLSQGVYQVSMPASIEAFVHQRLPAASRIEFCHTAQQMVIHRGWEPMAEGCQAGPEDTVIPFDESPA